MQLQRVHVPSLKRHIGDKIDSYMSPGDECKALGLMYLCGLLIYESEIIRSRLSII